MRESAVRAFAQYVAVVAGFLALSMAAAAQPSSKPYRIGWLSHGSAPPDSKNGVGDFRQAMRDAGYVEGTNFVIVPKFANGRVERLPELAAELARLPVAIIVTAGEPAALAAKRATSTIPIVFTEIAMDPVKAELVSSLNRPGANITGLAIQGTELELWQKRLGLLKQIVPKVSRVAVLWNPANRGNESCKADINAASSAMAIQPRFLEVSDAGAVERAREVIAKEQTDAVAMCWDSVILANASSTADFASKRGLPTLAPLRDYVVAGSLLALGTSLEAEQRRTAYYVDKLLKGAKPADIPVEQLAPMVFVNLTTSESLRLQIPPSMQLSMEEPIR